MLILRQRLTAFLMECMTVLLSQVYRLWDAKQWRALKVAQGRSISWYMTGKKSSVDSQISLHLLYNQVRLQII